MSFYADIDLLIVKVMPSVAHHTACGLLSEDFRFKLQAMGVPRGELVPIGSADHLKNLMQDINPYLQGV